MLSQDFFLSEKASLFQDTWRALLDAKEAGVLSYGSKRQLVEVLSRFQPGHRPEDLFELDDSVLITKVDGIYKAIRDEHEPELQTGYKKVFDFISDGIKPGHLPKLVREFQKAAEKAGLDPVELPESGIKESLELLVAIEDIAEKSQDGVEIKESDLPAALSAEALGKYFVDMIMEDNLAYKTRIDENGDLRAVLEELNAKIMAKKKPMDRVNQYGRKLIEINTEKLSKAPKKHVKGVIGKFKDTFTTQKHDPLHKLYDPVEGLRREYLQRGYIDKDYTATVSAPTAP
jgi:hypothetical protein